MVTLEKKRLSRKELTNEVAFLREQLLSVEKRLGSLSDENNALREIVIQNQMNIVNLNIKVEKLQEENNNLNKKNEEYLEAIKNTPDASTIMREWLMGGN